MFGCEGACKATRLTSTGGGGHWRSKQLAKRRGDRERNLGTSLASHAEAERADDTGLNTPAVLARQSSSPSVPKGHFFVRFPANIQPQSWTTMPTVAGADKAAFSCSVMPNLVEQAWYDKLAAKVSNMLV